MSPIHLLLATLIYFTRLSVRAESVEAESAEFTENATEFPGTSIKGPFTIDFSEWLKENKYHVYDFASAKLGIQASFGGRQHRKQEVKRRPVLFIHGNSDGALAEGREQWAQGWSATIEHFMEKGYTSAELYALTHGDRNLANSLNRSMDCQTLIRLRRFVEAILQYTGADKVDIVAHSMGVTLARHIIQGRSLEELALKEAIEQDMDQCYLGPSIRHRVHTLVGIAGANYGLCLCADERLAETMPACSKKTGFWAGSGCPDAPLDECHLTMPAPHRAHCHGGGKYATILHQLNMPEKPKDANFVVSLWSTADAITGPTNFAWGRLTSLIPNSDHSAIYDNHSHYSIKWATVQDQYGFIAQQQQVEIKQESELEEGKKEGKITKSNESVGPKKSKNGQMGI